MADRYPNYAALALHEKCGVDFSVQLRRAGPLAILAPHGGGIEPGTSELAEAIAGAEHSFYAFVGAKTSGNAELHITSTHFDEPQCSELLQAAQTVITLHGECGESGAGVFIGGLDRELGLALARALRGAGFDVREQVPAHLQGNEPSNLCNRGSSGRGVQLELAQALRAQMFRTLTRSGRTQRTARFGAFVAAVRGALVR